MNFCIGALLLLRDRVDIMAMAAMVFRDSMHNIPQVVNIIPQVVSIIPQVVSIIPQVVILQEWLLLLGSILEHHLCNQGIALHLVATILVELFHLMELILCQIQDTLSQVRL